MAAKGYATNEQVARFLSRTLSAEQLTQLGNVIEAAEQYIDMTTELSWMGDPIEDYYVQAFGSQFYLGPIDSIESLVSFGYGVVTPYTILDKFKGKVRLGYPVLNGAGYLVNYTPMQQVPALINRACIVIAAHWMMPTLDTDRFGAKSYQIVGDFSVSLIDPTDIPVEAASILGKFGGDLVLA